MNTNDQGLTYERWMAEVDAAVRNIAGVSVHDLPDFNSHDEWAEGCLPVESAVMLLEEEGFPFAEAEDTFRNPPPEDSDEGIPEWSAPFVPGDPFRPSKAEVDSALSVRRTTGKLPVMYR